MDAIASIGLVILVLILLKLSWDVYILRKTIQIQQITLNLHNISLDILAKLMNITLPTATSTPTPTPTTTK